MPAGAHQKFVVVKLSEAWGKAAAHCVVLVAFVDHSTPWTSNAGNNLSSAWYSKRAVFSLEISHG
jgi:hypothetical protein